PTSWVLVASSLIQLPVTCDVLIAVGIVPWCGVAAVATENTVVPASPAKHPITSAITGGRGHNTATALTAASATGSNGSQGGPKALRCNRTADGTAASMKIAASAQRPSQLDLLRHAHTGPIPNSAATAGASATV